MAERLGNMSSGDMECTKVLKTTSQVTNTNIFTMSVKTVVYFTFRFRASYVGVGSDLLQSF